MTPATVFSCRTGVFAHVLLGFISVICVCLLQDLPAVIVLGLIGASMILLRPLPRADDDRKHCVHTHRTMSRPAGQGPDLSELLQHGGQRAGSAARSAGKHIACHLGGSGLHGRKQLYRNRAQLHGEVHRRAATHADAELLQLHAVGCADSATAICVDRVSIFWAATVNPAAFEPRS
jgi:hypothetical protein